MFMCKTTIQNIVAIKGILSYFELTLSLKVNLQKVSFYIFENIDWWEPQEKRILKDMI